MTPALTPALQRIVGRLDALDERSSDTLAGALAGPLDFDDVVDFARFDPRNYCRNLVLRRPEYELRVLCWLPGQRTSLHGHHGAACAFRVMSGTSTEIRLGAPDNRWNAPDIIAERGSNFVHQVTNLGEEPLVSLHAYAPSLGVDQPPRSYEGRHVVIIGGGAAGAALAIHLLDGANGLLRVTIVERRQWLGRGPAYGTTDPAFRLNVPAERMSLYPKKPSDFVDWAKEQGEAVPPGALLPRRLFGEYVEDRLGDAIARSSGKVWFHRTSAISAGPEGVLLADGAFLQADAVVLATGNQLPAAPEAVGMDVLRSPHVVADPWTDGALGGIARDEELLILGTGLTMVDVMQALRNQGHRGRVVAISRRGLLPARHLHPHDPRRKPVQIDPAKLPRSARALSVYLRHEAQRLEREGIGWQCLIDGLRPHTAALWEVFPAGEKARFMKKLRPFWEVARHRAAPEALESIDAWRRAGRLEVCSGTITEVSVDKGLHTKLTLRGGRTIERRFDKLVLCTGPQTDVRRWRGLLFRNLLLGGKIQADALGLGLVTDEEGRVIDKDGRPSDWLSTLGSLRRAKLWETTALPELVQQAETLAARLLAS